jgi:hypothetical protein
MNGDARGLNVRAASLAAKLNNAAGATRATNAAGKCHKFGRLATTDTAVAIGRSRGERAQRQLS